MNFEQTTTILLALAGILIGAYLGALFHKLIISGEKNNLHYPIYISAIIVFAFAIIWALFNWNILVTPNWYGLFVVCIAIGSSFLICWYTKKHLVVKNTYPSSELTPIINKFTGLADRNEIKLFGGDLNFFGNSPSEMDVNQQYAFLKSLTFRNILILCEQPNNASTQLRYGKILTELTGVELRYYDPQEADLKVRGRIITVGGVNRLLMYTKVSQGNYRAVPTDTSNSNGALYHNIWELVWSLAIPPRSQEVQSYKDLFQSRQ